MTDANIQTIQNQIDQAESARTILLSKMTDDYDSSHLETFKNLQEQIKEWNQQIEEAQKAQNVEVGTCQVSILRGGKDDQAFEIRADSTLGDLMDNLGWNTGDLSFLNRVGTGKTAEITDPGAHVFGPGEHEIFITHRVAAG